MSMGVLTQGLGSIPKAKPIPRAGRFGRLYQQDVTYWEPDTGDRYGNTTWKAGVEIKARWEDKVEQVQNANGEEVMSKSIVYMEGTRLIEEDWRMALGSLSTSDPDDEAKAYRVVAARNMPGVRNRRSQIKVWLA